jgi:hypothetical protein
VPAGDRQATSQEQMTCCLPADHGAAGR